MRELWLVMVLGLVAPQAASAQAAAIPPASTGDEQDARLHFELGRRAYARAEYETAAREFEAALALAERVELHYNLFLVYHELDRDEEAVAQLRAYVPHEADAAARSFLEARLARMEAALAARTPPPHDDEPPAPSIGVGESASVPDAPAGDARPPDPSPSTDAPSGSSDVEPGVIALLASGGALLVGGAVVGGLALADQASLDGACTSTCPPALASTQDRGRALAIASDVLWITGAVAAAAGLAWWLIAASTGEQAPVTAAAACTGEGCALVVRGEL